MTSIDYKLDNFKVDRFILNEDETTFELQIGGLTVDSKKDEVIITFDWEFKEHKFDVHDSGKGQATSKNLHLKVVFTLETTSSLRVVDCKLELKDFGKQT